MKTEQKIGWVNNLSMNDTELAGSQFIGVIILVAVVAAVISMFMGASDGY